MTEQRTKLDADKAEAFRVAHCRKVFGEELPWLEEQERWSPLWPYIVNWRGWRVPGEQPAHCPLHHDRHPSMSINFRKGVWRCHAGCGGGSIRHLLDSRDAWVPNEEHPAFRGRA